MFILVLPGGIYLEDVDAAVSVDSLTPTDRKNRGERLEGVKKHATRIGSFDLLPCGDAMRAGKDTLAKSYPLMREMGATPRTVSSLATKLGWRSDRVRRHLRDLEGFGIAEREGQQWALANNAINRIDHVGSTSSKAGTGEQQRRELARKRVIRQAEKIRHIRGQGTALDHDWESFDVYDATTGEFFEACQRRLTERELAGQQGVVGGILLSLGKVTFSDAHGFPVGQLDRWYGDDQGLRDIVKRPRRYTSGQSDYQLRGTRVSDAQRLMRLGGTPFPTRDGGGTRYAT
jgi:hypothetical protein